MPASHERVPNRHLSGVELREIIEKDVNKVLSRDGMFSNNIGFSRVSYEVRVSVHMDNPIYPEHIATILSKKASIQEVEANPAMAAIETGPLAEPVTDEDSVFSGEISRQIASPNMARIENDMPLTIERKNMDTGHPETIQQKFKGNVPDPATVGNVATERDTTEDQRGKWNRPKRSQK